MYYHLPEQSIFLTPEGGLCVPKSKPRAKGEVVKGTIRGDGR